MAEETSDKTVLEGAGAYFLSVVEASQDCIRVISADGYLEYMNAQGKFLLEIEDFEGRNRHQYWPDMWPLESRDTVEQALRAAMAGNAVAFRAPCPTAKGAPRWWDTTVSPILEGGRVIRVLATSRDVTGERLAESHRQLLVNELNHRVKNTLVVVQSLARHSLKGGGELGLAQFNERLLALAGAHDLLTRRSWEGADLGELVAEALQPYATQVSIEGPATPLAPNAAVALAMILHELATNASKYGALSTEAGRIQVSWTMESRTRLRLIWRERGGPPVKPPSRRGFGSRLITSSLRGDLSGASEFDYAPEGLTCVFRLQTPPRAAS